MVGPIRTGGKPLRTLSSRRCRYVVGVTSNAPKLKVGSTVKIEKTLGLVQNCTKSSSWRSRANTNTGSGDALVPLTNIPVLSPSFACCIISNISSLPLELACGFDRLWIYETWRSLRGSWDALRAFTTPPSFVLTMFRVSFGTDL